MISEKDIEALFAKQLARIGDAGLRAKVVKTFVLACRRGGWESVEDVKKMPFTLLTDAHGVSFVEHTIAVTEGAAALARAQAEAYAKMPYAIDMDRLYRRRAPPRRRQAHRDRARRRRAATARAAPASSPATPSRAPSWPPRCGLADDVVNTIACHAKEGDGRPQVVETVLIHQADFATFDPLVMKQKGLLIET